MKFGALLQLLKFGVDSSNTVLPFNYQRKCREYSKFGVRCFKSVLEFVTGWKFLIIRSLITHSWMEHSSEPGQGQYDQDGVGCEGLESGGCSFSIEYVSFVGEQPESTLPSMSSFTFFSPSPATTQNNNTHETNEKLRVLLTYPEPIDAAVIPILRLWRNCNKESGNTIEMVFVDREGDSDGRNRQKFVGIDRFRRISDEPIRRYRFVGKKNSSEFRQNFRRLSDEYRETSF
uniref:Uncharacterized protein n=1 Tax=Brassica oleracea TaxID=3712 RepID=A0A3P6CE68_BRAOL|nr:unnamed protein product [Brassica oleracea]